MSLESLSCDQIRKNWTKENAKNETLFTLVWDDFLQKTNMLTRDPNTTKQRSYYKANQNDINTLKTFLMSDEKTLVFREINGENRQAYQSYCDVLRLHHITRHIKLTKKKVLYINKPTEWFWEFTTEKNPYKKRGKQPKEECCYCGDPDACRVMEEFMCKNCIGDYNE